MEETGGSEATEKKEEIETKRDEMEDVRFHVLQCKLFYMLITVLAFTICVTLANNSLCLGFHWMKM